MAKETDFGTFDELIAGKDPCVIKIAITLRRLIYQLHPESVEVVRLGDKAASFGVGPKKMSEAYVYIMPLRDRVNLGFYLGADLPDPQKLLEGTGKNLRHTKVHTMEIASSPALHDLITASITERKAHFNL